ncbi:MAG TPA: type II toxin-antitoxin system HicB family antitoxin [Aestuariivirgaceae bacterium]|jgi:predicted RNase H-like HicB family nuclease|nr:type II toxin-antitoxin system HicB family antitoxin [Aestuariivirgaceae bacterium]
MARMTYWAVLEKGEDGGFGVFFPDLDGCITLGETAAEAADNAREALSLHLETMEEAGQELPTPRDLQELKAEVERNRALNIEAYLLVWADTHAGERVNVYLPRALLERVDRFVSAAGMNRSSFFGLAARRMLEQEKGKTIR